MRRENGACDNKNQSAKNGSNAMSIQSIGMHASQIADTYGTLAATREPTPPAPTMNADDPKLREAFDKFVGETFYGQMLKALRSSVGKPAYFHGGRTEEVFQAQLDQLMTEEMTEASASQFTGPMFELFSLTRS